MIIQERYSAFPNEDPMVGKAGATIVWSSAARNITSRTPTTMSLRAPGSIARLGLVSVSFVGGWRFTVRSSWQDEICLRQSPYKVLDGEAPRFGQAMVRRPARSIQDSPECLFCDWVRPEFMDGAPVFDRGDDRRVWFDRLRHNLKLPPP